MKWCSMLLAGIYRLRLSPSTKQN